MTSACLALRVSRRALAAVSLSADDLTFHDGRHLPSNADRAQRAAARYLATILGLTHPQLVVIDAPAKDGSLTTAILTQARQVLAERQIPAENIAMSDVLSSFGVPGLRTRAELRTVIEPFWPALAAMKGRVKPYVLEAAAVAEYADARDRLGVPAPG
jgi:hypothetical protein